MAVVVPGVILPKQIDIAQRVAKAAFVSATGMRAKNVAVEIVAERSIQRKTIAVNTDDGHGVG